MVTVYRKMTTEPGNDWSCIFCNGLQIFGSMWCGIFVFCLLLFPQNIRKIYKLTQLSLSKFVYFWAQSHLCLLLQKKVFYGKVNIHGSVLKKYTNWDKLGCISFDRYFSLVLRNKKRQKPNILHLYLLDVGLNSKAQQSMINKKGHVLGAFGTQYH
jgi:hypothetical protein